MDTSRVVEVTSDELSDSYWAWQENRYYAICDACSVRSGEFKNKTFPEEWLVKHRKERKHLTNTASPTRFTV